MNPIPAQRPVDQTHVSVDDAAEILGVNPTVLEDLIRWGELPSITVEDQLAITRATLDGLFDLGVGSEHDLDLDLDL
jgi:hypothetical protein